MLNSALMSLVLLERHRFGTDFFLILLSSTMKLTSKSFGDAYLYIYIYIYSSVIEGLQSIFALCMMNHFTCDIVCIKVLVSILVLDYSVT